MIEDARNARLILSIHDLGAWIEALQPLLKFIHCASVHEVGFGDPQMIGHQHLSERLGIKGQLLLGMHGIHGRHHRAQLKMRLEHRISQERMQGGQWVGKSRRFDHDLFQVVSSLVASHVMDLHQGLPQGVRDGATKAARVKQINVVGDLAKNPLIQPHFAKLIDHDGKPPTA